jgi:phage terminase large subunit-like protein
VFLPRTALWLADYIHELTSFPGTRYDDQVDSTTQFLDYVGLDNALEIWARLGA